MTLVQKAGLGGGGLGCGGDHHGTSPAGGAQIGHEVGIGTGIIAREIFKVDVHTFVSSALQLCHDLIDQPLPCGGILQHGLTHVRGELSVRPQGGQVEQGRGAHLAALDHQRVRFGRDEIAGRCEPIGEGGHGGEEGEGGAQQLQPDGGVGVGVDDEGHIGRVLAVGHHELLSRLEQGRALQGGVVPPQLTDGQPVHLGDACQGVTGLNGVYLLWIAHHDGLPHRQPGRIGELVVTDELRHGHAILLGDEIEGVARPDHMDIHGLSSF